MNAIPSGPAKGKPSLQQLFSYPFRIFFLSMTLLALITIPLWILVITGTIRLPLAMPGLFWHQHEMLFGFLSAAIAGFLLTAVCVWTSTERTHGWQLFLLWLVWFAYSPPWGGFPGIPASVLDAGLWDFPDTLHPNPGQPSP